MSSGNDVKTQQARQAQQAKQAQQVPTAQQVHIDTLSGDLALSQAQTVEHALADSLTDSTLRSETYQQASIYSGTGNSSASSRAANGTAKVELRNQPSMHYSGMLGVEDNETYMDSGSGVVYNWSRPLPCPTALRPNPLLAAPPSNSHMFVLLHHFVLAFSSCIRHSPAAPCPLPLPSPSSAPLSHTPPPPTPPPLFPCLVTFLTWMLCPKPPPCESDNDYCILLCECMLGVIYLCQLCGGSHASTRQIFCQAGSDQLPHIERKQNWASFLDDNTTSTLNSISYDPSQADLDVSQTGTDVSKSELGEAQAGFSKSLGRTTGLSPSRFESLPQNLPEDWDWESYLRLNPDVATAVGSDAESASLHWQQWGHTEKRPYKVGHT